MREMPKCFSSKCLSIFAAIAVLITDQLTKIAVVSYLEDGSQVIAPFFNIIFVKNKGVTFGLFNSIASPSLLIVAAIVASAILIVFAKHQAPYYRLPTSLIIAGALGNIIDRILYGAVIDFLDFHLYGYHWPAFNIADSAIVIGVMTLFIISYLEEKEKKI